jgi:hypothetical protein
MASAHARWVGPLSWLGRFVLSDESRLSVAWTELKSGDLKMEL